MLFVREALEQATHEAVARYHASKFPVGELVADLTCGIGSDLAALAARGPAIGFEMDPERAACARHNVPQAEVRQQDCLEAEWTWQYAFADPSRRVAGRRTVDPREFSPDPRVLADRMGALRLGGIKLSPLLPDRFLECLGPGLEFISYGRECGEALVWTGRDAPSGRWAVHLESGERLDGPNEAPPPVDSPDAMLFDPDPAAVRAHALGTLCRSHGLQPLGDGGYLTGPAAVASPWLRGYRALWSGDLKGARAAARALGLRPAEVKARGVRPDATAIRKADPGAGEPASLVVYAIGRSVRAAWAVAVRPQ